MCSVFHLVDSFDVVDYVIDSYYGGYYVYGTHYDVYEDCGWIFCDRDVIATQYCDFYEYSIPSVFMDLYQVIVYDSPFYEMPIGYDIRYFW